MCKPVYFQPMRNHCLRRKPEARKPEMHTGRSEHARYSAVDQSCYEANLPLPVRLNADPATAIPGF